MDERRRYRRGMSVRRAVLGNAHVDQALENRTDLDEDFQDLITRYAWGEIWTRPGLSRSTRSLVTVAMMVALNRNEELRMHLAAALRNGVTRQQIQEVLLHAGIYCGLPAAHAAFRVAAEVLAGVNAGRGRKDDRHKPRSHRSK